MGTYITSLQLENVKRVQALRLLPSPKGLTVIGGKSGAGKTSVLDGLIWTLGGNRKAPSSPQREGSLNPPSIDVVLSNGIRVRRSGKKGALTVTDPDGNKAGQALLDSFIGQFALDLPKFMQGNAKTKADALLQALGIGDALAGLEKEEKRLYDDRTVIGRIALSKKKHAEELPEYTDAPNEPVSMSALIKEQQAILAKNGENQHKRDELVRNEERCEQVIAEIERLETQLRQLRKTHSDLSEAVTTGKKTVDELEDESTAALEAQIEDIESINQQVAANQAKQHAADEANEYQQQYEDLSSALEAKRDERMSLLDGAALPLPGLSIADGELQYNGRKWDCMGGAEQLQVATAVVRAIQPECSFVLLDQLEKMDPDTMREFGEWLEQEGLQVIATRVTTDKDDCTLIIEDGLPQGSTFIEQTTGVIADETVTEHVDYYDEEEGF